MKEDTVRYSPGRLSAAGFLSLLEQGKGGLFLLYGDPEVNSLAQRLLVVPLSRGYGVVVLDAGNRFDPYLISRMARASGRTPREFLSRILVSRSFTCHQTHALVRRAAHLHSDASGIILVLGCLTTFYDEDVPLAERRILLGKTVALLKEISRRRRVLVTSADSPANGRERLRSLLLDAADRVVRVERDRGGAPGIDPARGIRETAAGSPRRGIGRRWNHG